MAHGKSDLRTPKQPGQSSKLHNSSSSGSNAHQSSPPQSPPSNGKGGMSYDHVTSLLTPLILYNSFILISYQQKRSGSRQPQPSDSSATSINAPLRQQSFPTYAESAATRIPIQCWLPSSSPLRFDFDVDF